MPDSAIGPQCRDARARFAEALDDPAAEGAVLGHCLQCSSCMAAYTELKETVDKLVAAAEAVPPSDTFATAVVRSIQAEKKRRRSRQAASAIVGVLVFTAVVLAVAATLHLADSGEPDLAPGYEWLAEDGDEPPPPLVDRDEPDGPDRKTEPGPKADEPEPAKPEPEIDEPGPTAEPAAPDKPAEPGKPKVPFPQSFYDELRKLEKDILLSGGRGGRGKNRGRFFKVMDQGRLLTTGELELVVERLEKELESMRKEPERRLRKAVLQRCKSLLKHKLSGKPTPRWGRGRRNSGK